MIEIAPSQIRPHWLRCSRRAWCPSSLLSPSLYFSASTNSHIQYHIHSLLRPLLNLSAMRHTCAFHRATPHFIMRYRSIPLQLPVPIIHMTIESLPLTLRFLLRPLPNKDCEHSVPKMKTYRPNTQRLINVSSNISSIKTST